MHTHLPNFLLATLFLVIFKYLSILNAAWYPTYWLYLQYTDQHTFGLSLTTDYLFFINNS